jgi:hypothetical protein
MNVPLTEARFDVVGQISVGGCDKYLHNAGINDVRVPEHVHHAALLHGRIHRGRVAMVTVVHGG